MNIKPYQFEPVLPVDKNRSDSDSNTESEQSEKIFDITDRNQIDALRAGLYSSYECQQYTDISLIVEGKEILCHRNVLAAMSPFFNTMFSCEMSEKYQKQISLPYIEKFDIMIAVVKYMYTGAIKLISKDDTIQQLYLAANFFQMNSLVKRCIEHIGQITDKCNCLSTLQFAMKYDCAPILEKAKKVICENYMEVSKQDEFLCLDIDLVREIMQWDQLKIESELYLLECCRNWLNKQNMESREQHSESLLDCVKFQNLEPQLLKTALCDVLVLKTLRPVNLCKLKRILKYPLRKFETDFDYTVRKSFRKEDYVVMVIPVLSLDFQKRMDLNLNSHSRYNFEDNNLRLYNLHDSKTTLTCRLPEATACTEVCVTGNGQIYITGLFKKMKAALSYIERLRLHMNAPGDVEHISQLTSLSQHQEATKEIGLFYFESEEQAFVPLHSMRIKRKNFAFVAVDKNLFTIGGQSTKGRLFNSVEKYNTENKKWYSFPSLPIAISNPCAIGFKGRLYVFGGESCDGICGKVFCYSKIKKTFEELPSLQRARSRACAAIYRREIYVVGGLTAKRNGKEFYTRSVEIFDVQSNNWKKGPNLPYPLKRPSAVKNGNSIIIMGLRKKKLLCYTLVDINGHEGWVRQYLTGSMTNLWSNFKCANLLVTRKMPYNYNIYGSRNGSSDYTEIMANHESSDADEDYSNDSYYEHSPYCDSDEEYYYGYDS